MLKKITAAAALATMAASSWAGTPGSFYAGVDAGSSKLTDYSATRGSFGGFAGYNFTENFALEGGVRRLASIGDQTMDIDVDQYALSGIGTLPLSNGFSVYGRLGVNRLEGKVVYSALGTFKDHTTKVLYGIGAGYDFGNKLSGRVEVQKPSSDSTNLSVGLSYAF